MLSQVLPSLRERFKSVFLFLLLTFRLSLPHFRFLAYLSGELGESSQDLVECLLVQGVTVAVLFGLDGGIPGALKSRAISPKKEPAPRVA